MIKIIISLVAAILAIIHLIFPDLKVDSITVSLLVVSIIPWLGALFKSIELPGGLKVEYQDLKNIETRMRQEGFIGEPSIPAQEPLYVRIASEDPNLALAGLRIELEKELLALAERKGVQTKNASLRSISSALAHEKLISAGAYMAVADLTSLLNSAVHGAKVEDQSLNWALTVGPQVLESVRAIK